MEYKYKNDNKTLTVTFDNGIKNPKGFKSHVMIRISLDNGELDLDKEFEYDIECIYPTNWWRWILFKLGFSLKVMDLTAKYKDGK